MDELVGGGTWVLRGTEAQNAILKPVFVQGDPSFIAFPWDKGIRVLNTPIPISWDDLNDGTLAVAVERAFGGHDHPGEDDPMKIPGHIHIEDEDGNEGHAVLRYIDGRWGIAGVFWTDGRIKIDISLEAYPQDAREVLSAEIAHAVDFGMPFTDSQKQQIMNLMHGGGADGHTWWEIQSYGGEYYTLGGEANMAKFTHAYSKMEPYQAPFTHKSTHDTDQAYQDILGVQAIGSTPDVQVKYLKGYRTFHKSGPGTHYEALWATKQDRVVKLTKTEALAQGKVACRICKP